MQKLTEQFNTASVKKGDTFYIALHSNPSTGYCWNLEVTAGKATLEAEDFIPASTTQAVGSGGQEVYVYTAEETGEIEIEAQYKRPWETGPGVKSQKFKINVA